MKLLRCEVTNFGSYPHLELDFTDIGLGLIYGPTGAGKSTIPDIACWILFGETAKGGAVDEVRSWLNPDKPTIGLLTLETNGEVRTVRRVRGRSSENDLCIINDHEGLEQCVTRGKDISDTQKMLNKLLGVDADLYLTAAYFSEFSPTGNFFMAKAKERRATLEKVANLDFPVQLSQKVADARKTTKKTVEDLDLKFNKASGAGEQLATQYDAACEEANTWQTKQVARIKELEQGAANFAREKATKVALACVNADKWSTKHHDRIDEVNARLDAIAKRILPVDEAVSLQERIKYLDKLSTADVCPTCLGPRYNTELAHNLAQHKQKLAAHKEAKEQLVDQGVILTNLIATENPHALSVLVSEGLQNPYYLMIEAKGKEVNPFDAQLMRLLTERAKAELTCSQLQKQYDAAASKLLALLQLVDLSNDLRGQLLHQAVEDIQTQTNQCLEKYFDAELRVQFTLKGSDDLDVVIHKNGYECVYRQLSKGQRQLLKLAFCTSIMKAAANRAGVHFDNLFLDEAFDGLDADLKVKAFAMLQDLESMHKSILVVDHSVDFQSLFATRYHVTMEADASHIELEHG